MSADLTDSKEQCRIDNLIQMLTFESDCPKTMFLPVPAAGSFKRNMK